MSAPRRRVLVTGGGRYLMITGGGAEHVKPDDAPVSIGLAGQLMLARALAAEAPHGVRFGALVLESPIAARSRAEVDPAWPSADQVGDEVSRLLELAELPVINRYGRAPVPA